VVMKIKISTPPPVIQNSEDGSDMFVRNIRRMTYKARMRHIPDDHIIITIIVINFRCQEIILLTKLS
jgi:hypothetical protein